jgi:AAHS family benzoate transporter-like MFS transporter
MPGRTRDRAWVLPLCWASVLLEGFDLVVLGTVLPVLLRDKVWGLNPGTASAVTTIGLFGMMVGALAIGTITDIIGRRKALIFAVTSFSVFTLLCAVVNGVVAFGALRFLAGLGLGGCLATAIALVTEFSRSGKSSSSTTTLMTGYHVGAILTALLGILLIPEFGWRAMFVAGAIPALVLVPLMLRSLPESDAFLAAKASGERRDSSATKESLQAVKALFQGGLTRATISFWVASFMGLVLVYGLNTWLPEIMRTAGYPLGAALSLLLTLNIGAVLGLLIGGPVADRIGIRPATLIWFGAAAVFLALLAVKLPGFGLYVAVLVAGIFVFSSQVLVYAYVGRVYPAPSRATALGWAAGTGRLGAITGPIIGGALLSAGIAYPWGFFAFAIVGALGGLAVVAVSARMTEPAEETVSA